MTQSVRALIYGVWRVMFRRGSPERILYSRWRFIGALALAIAASALVQWLYFGDHLVFIILRVFAELTLFMLMMVVLTARVARLRLASLMLVLVLISLFVDSLLLLLTPLPLGDWRQPVALVVGLTAVYGAGSSVAWALRKSLLQGCAIMLVYAGLVAGLDAAFRALYAMAAIA